VTALVWCTGTWCQEHADWRYSWHTARVATPFAMGPLRRHRPCLTAAFLSVQVIGRAILTELAAATRSVCAWYPALIARVEASMSVGIPTPNGMLILKRTPTTAPFSPCEYLATSWISDALIETRLAQTGALASARTNGGIVLQVGEKYIALARFNMQDWIALSPPFANAFYSEMLRHLPLAGPITQIVYGANR